MKKLTVAIALGLGMALPVGVMAADDDVTIRVMEMNEVSSDAVMQQIELPDTASEQALENGQPGNRERERVRQLNGENGEQQMTNEGEMEQEREMEQLRERAMEQHQDQQGEPPESPQGPSDSGMPGPGGPG